jgi:hypothetical protein
MKPAVIAPSMLLLLYPLDEEVPGQVWGRTSRPVGFRVSGSAEVTAATGIGPYTCGKPPSTRISAGTLAGSMRSRTRSPASA